MLINSGAPYMFGAGFGEKHVCIKVVSKIMHILGKYLEYLLKSQFKKKVFPVPIIKFLFSTLRHTYGPHMGQLI